MTGGVTADAATQRAIRALKRRDAVLRDLIRKVGPCRLHERRRADPFAALVSAIVSQQVSTSSARAIHTRLMQAFTRSTHPSPRQILRKSDEQLRAVGLSRAKVAYVKDLSRCVLNGTVPEVAELESMADDDIVDRLTQVQGIGRWTVEMLLLFQLGRPDILPVGDLGVRKGYMLAYGLDAMPAPADLLGAGAAWRPYRSIASWSLWRATDSVPELLERK